MSMYVELVRKLAKSNDMEGVLRISKWVAENTGRSEPLAAELVKIIKKGMLASPPEPPTQQARPSQSVLNRFDALHNWRKRRAAQRGVESDVIVSRKALWELASQNPKTLTDLKTIKYLGDWQRSEYGQELLSVLGQIRRKR